MVKAALWAGSIVVMGIAVNLAGPIRPVSFQWLAAMGCIGRNRGVIYCQREHADSPLLPLNGPWPWQGNALPIELLKRNQTVK